MTDNRKYKSWKEDNNNEDITTISYLPDNSGMILARRALNKLHRMLAKDGYKQVAMEISFTGKIFLVKHFSHEVIKYIQVNSILLSITSQNCVRILNKQPKKI